MVLPPVREGAVCHANDSGSLTPGYRAEKEKSAIRGDSGQARRSWYWPSGRGLKRRQATFFLLLQRDRRSLHKAAVLGGVIGRGAMQAGLVVPDDYIAGQPFVAVNA